MTVENGPNNVIGEWTKGYSQERVDRSHTRKGLHIHGSSLNRRVLRDYRGVERVPFLN